MCPLPACLVGLPEPPLPSLVVKKKREGGSYWAIFPCNSTVLYEDNLRAWRSLHCLSPWFSKASFFLFFLFRGVAPCSMWDLSFPTRDWTHPHCSGSKNLTTGLLEKSSNAIFKMEHWYIFSVPGTNLIHCLRSTRSSRLNKEQVCLTQKCTAFHKQISPCHFDGTCDPLSFSNLNCPVVGLRAVPQLWYYMSNGWFSMLGSVILKEIKESLSLLVLALAYVKHKPG